MSYSKACTFALCASFALLSISPASAQVVNGDFENPSRPGYQTLPAAGPLPGWNVGGTIDHGTAPAQTPCAGGAGQCVDLNGGAPGGISQTFPLTCTPKYRLSFMMSRHRMLGKTPATLVANANGTQQTFTHSTPLNASGSWEPRTLDFVGSPSSTISFKSTTNAPVSAAAGPQIDKVSVKFLSCE